MHKLVYALIADVIVVFHGVIIIALMSSFIFESVLKRKFPDWWNYIFVPMVLITITGQIILFDCPLNPIENHFRELAGEAVYQGSFIGYYLTQAGINISARNIDMLTGLVLGVLFFDILSRWHTRK